MKKLIDKLMFEGGMIICTASMEIDMIEQARASDRMYVNDDGVGFVWEPMLKMPTTAKEVVKFEEYYPLEVDTSHIDFDAMFEKIYAAVTK